MPLQQGEFDGLCGLYTIINGLRLVVPLTDGQCERLFKQGIDFLANRDRLTICLRWGMPSGLWRALTDELASKAARLTKTPLLLDRPFLTSAPTKSKVSQDIGLAMFRDAPVLVLLRGEYRHYTVIRGITPTRLLLHDSYGYHWIPRSACSFTGRDIDMRHRLAARSLTIIGAE